MGELADSRMGEWPFTCSQGGANAERKEDICDLYMSVHVCTCLYMSVHVIGCALMWYLLLLPPSAFCLPPMPVPVSVNINSFPAAIRLLIISKSVYNTNMVHTNRGL
jgi:hypothetical protein